MAGPFMFDPILGFINDAANAAGSVMARLKYITDNMRLSVGAYAVASANVKTLSATERSASSSTPVKIKEVKMLIPGAVRIIFDHAGTAGYTVYAQIYKNGAIAGTARLAYDYTFTTWTEDITVTTGDLVQIYVNGNSAKASFVKNFKVALDEIQSPAALILD